MKNLLLTPSIIILISTLLSAQLIENVQIPVSMFAATATTDPDPSLYQFEEIENTLQGVNIYLPPTEVATLYLQSGNHKIAFNTLLTSIFMFKLEVNYDGAGWVNEYDSSSGIQSVGWIDTPSSFNTIGEHSLEVRYLDALQGLWIYREYVVQIVPPASGFYRDGTMTISSGGYILTHGNQIYSYDNPMFKDADPVLVVEGFDPVNSVYPEFYSQRGAYLTERLFEMGYKGYVLNFNLNT